MQYRHLGRTDLEVSALCLGTMTWGSQNTAEEGHAQMDMALDYGINFFDTAEMYAVPASPETSFRTETIIGDWFAKTGNRDKIILATKAAAGAAGGYGSSQMAQTGVGHPGPAPAPSGGDIGSAAGGAYAGATAPWGGSSAAAGGDNGPIEPDPTTGPEPGPGSEPPVVDPGPPEAGRPDSGPGTTPIPTAWTPEPPTPPAAPAGTDREDDTP